MRSCHSRPEADRSQGLTRTRTQQTQHTSHFDTKTMRFIRFLLLLTCDVSNTKGKKRIERVYKQWIGSCKSYFLLA